MKNLMPELQMNRQEVKKAQKKMRMRKKKKRVNVRLKEISTPKLDRIKADFRNYIIL
jgi:hypothetical protein